MKISWKDIVFPAIIGLMIGSVFAFLIRTAVEYNLEEFKEAEHSQVEYTNARPISQQKIGDDVEPDILIIYEAEVDGVKVYPSVIKEGK